MVFSVGPCRLSRVCGTCSLSSVSGLSACCLLVNQSIKIDIAPLPDPYSEVLPTQAKRKRTVFHIGWVFLARPSFLMVQGIVIPKVNDHFDDL